MKADMALSMVVLPEPVSPETMITGVSGGSFTALSYALYRDRLFDEYEERFLKRNVQGALLGRALNPVHWPRFVGGSAGRSELAADYYDEILFDGATFADLLVRPGPVAIATGTDMETEDRDGYDAVQIGFDEVKEKAAAISPCRHAVCSATSLSGARPSPWRLTPSLRESPKRRRWLMPSFPEAKSSGCYVPAACRDFGLRTSLSRKRPRI